MTKKYVHVNLYADYFFLFLQHNLPLHKPYLYRVYVQKQTQIQRWHKYALKSISYLAVSKTADQGWSYDPNVGFTMRPKFCPKGGTNAQGRTNLLTNQKIYFHKKIYNFISHFFGIITCNSIHRRWRIIKHLSSSIDDA